MLKKIFKESLIYLIIIMVCLVTFLIIKYNFMEIVMKIDNSVMTFFQSNLVNDVNTDIMKFITNFGDIVIFASCLIILYLFKKTRHYSFPMFANLVFVYLVSLVFKNIFMRARPLISLIEKPKDYSFPSGHTMCSIAFYGFFIYLLVTNIKNIYVKWIVTIMLPMLVIFIAISRLYLSVHYFSDVIGGVILGTVCLLMFINIYRKNMVV